MVSVSELQKDIWQLKCCIMKISGNYYWIIGLPFDNHLLSSSGLTCDNNCMWKSFFFNRDPCFKLICVTVLLLSFPWDIVKIQSLSINILKEDKSSVTKMPVILSSVTNRNIWILQLNQFLSSRDSKKIKPIINIHPSRYQNFCNL